MSCPPSWISCDLINDGFGDVESRVSHIKLLLCDLVTISACLDLLDHTFSAFRIAISEISIVSACRFLETI